jgi:hypothetical protein
MFASFARIAILVVALGAAGAALADDLADFSAALERVSTHNSAALDNLDKGQMADAVAEIEQVRESWLALQNRFAGRPPAPLAGNAAYGNLFTSVSARLVGADMMVKAGRPQAAKHSLDALRGDLDVLRQSLNR